MGFDDGKIPKASTLGRKSIYRSACNAETRIDAVFKVDLSQPVIQSKQLSWQYSCFIPERLWLDCMPPQP